MHIGLPSNSRGTASRLGSDRAPNGIAYVFALVMLGLLTSLAVAMMAGANLNLKRGENLHHSVSAQLSAESGLQFLLLCLEDVRMPADTDGETFMANLAGKLADKLDGTPNLGDGTVCLSGTTIWIPAITVGMTTFSCSVAAIAPDGDGTPRCRLSATGTSGLAPRTVCVDLRLTSKPADAFNYAIASRGSISVSGNATIDGVSSPDEGNILSIHEDAIAISLGGSATIGGDLFLTAEGEDSIYLSGGGLSVGGTSDVDEILAHHVHRLTDEPDFPELDLAPFASLATNVIDSGTDLTGPGLVLDNVRVAAGTNPEFTNDTVINGILYVEAPNKVTFKSKATVNAVIVTEDASELPLADNQLDFKGQVTAPGVSALPDTSEFADVKQQTGTIILAPGFGVTFRGGVNSINGTVAADQFSFRGNATIDGEVSGTIIGLSQSDLVMQGNATILVNRAEADPTPAGFVHYKGVSLVSGSYTETH